MVFQGTTFNTVVVVCVVSLLIFRLPMAMLCYTIKISKKFKSSAIAPFSCRVRISFYIFWTYRVCPAMLQQSLPQVMTFYLNPLQDTKQLFLPKLRFLCLSESLTLCHFQIGHPVIHIFEHQSKCYSLSYGHY